jgi:hypothetical protein
MDEARELVNDLEDAGFGPDTTSANGTISVRVAAEDQAEADQAAAIMAIHDAQPPR